MKTINLYSDLIHIYDELSDYFDWNDFLQSLITGPNEPWAVTDYLIDRGFHKTEAKKQIKRVKEFYEEHRDDIFFIMNFTDGDKPWFYTKEPAYITIENENQDEYLLIVSRFPIEWDI